MMQRFDTVPKHTAFQDDIGDLFMKGGPDWATSLATGLHAVKGTIHQFGAAELVTVVKEKETA